ncbi:hypothetical protein NL676_033750 [Syzygium grande]|nr:hypothetical protein NL676_033750 [Syzygium grande]
MAELKAVTPRAEGGDLVSRRPSAEERRRPFLRGSSRSLLALRLRAETEVSWVEVSNQFWTPFYVYGLLLSLSYSIVLALCDWVGSCHFVLKQIGLTKLVLQSYFLGRARSASSSFGHREPELQSSRPRCLGTLLFLWVQPP